MVAARARPLRMVEKRIFDEGLGERADSLLCDDAEAYARSWCLGFESSGLAPLL